VKPVASFPSESLSEILEQLGTLNDRHEQLKSLVETLDVSRKKISSSYDVFFFFISRKIKSIVMNSNHLKINSTIYSNVLLS